MNSLKIMVTLVFCFTPLLGYTRALYQNDNHSAEFLRNMNRNASTDIDAAYYNPAGLAMIPRDGFYLYVSDQMIFQKREVTDSSTLITTYIGDGDEVTYKGKAHTWIYPDIYVVYKKEKMAFFGHLGIIGAGASADFDDGLPSVDLMLFNFANGIISSVPYSDAINPATYDTSASIETYTAMYSATIGSAYKFTNHLSAAFAVRYIYSYQTTSVDAQYNNVTGVGGTTWAALQASGQFTPIEVDVDADGHCFGLIFGFDYMANSKLNFGFKYEWYSILKMKNNKPDTYNVPSNLSPSLAYLQEGYESKKTLPMSTQFGVSYKLTTAIELSTHFGYYFNTLADLGEDAGGNDLNKKVKDNWSTGLGIEYSQSSALTLSIGGTYTSASMTAESRTDAEYPSPTWSIGTGASYALNADQELTVGIMYIYHEDEEQTSIPTIGSDETVKTPLTINFGLGITWKMF